MSASRRQLPFRTPRAEASQVFPRLPKTGKALKAAPPKVGYAIVYMQISTILFYVECTQVLLSFENHSAEKP